MTCLESYALPWQFATFWCLDQLIQGTHEGAGPVDAALVYAHGDFVNRGVQINVGMTLYNVTQDTSGDVTAATATTITAAGVTWNAADAFRIVLMNGLEEDTIEHYLEVAAGDINAALHATGACDCTWASWVLNTDTAVGFLGKLNIIDAAAYHSCQCGQPRFTDTMKQKYLDWMSQQLSMLVTMELEICHGETGSQFPSMGWASQSVTDFASAQIIWNDILRNS